MPKKIILPRDTSKSKANKATISVETTKRTKDRLQYYANREGETLRQFVEKAIDERIAKLNGDYDIPNITVSRINQLAENEALVREELKLLRQAMNNGFSAILTLSNTVD